MDGRDARNRNAEYRCVECEKVICCGLRRKNLEVNVRSNRGSIKNPKPTMARAKRNENDAIRVHCSQVKAARDHYNRSGQVKMVSQNDGVQTWGERNRIGESRQRLYYIGRDGAAWYKYVCQCIVLKTVNRERRERGRRIKMVR